MKAFHNDPAIKAKYLARVETHRLADELVQKTTWENGKGCAIGCTLNGYDHKAYETELGIPEWMARLEDKIFEGLSPKIAQLWPERFLAAIKPGANLEPVKAPFLIFVLESTLATFDHMKFPAVKKAIDDVIALYRQNEIDPEKYRAATRAAWAAEEATRAAAWVEAATAWAAEEATRAAAWVEAATAWAAEEATRAAAWAAWAAEEAEEAAEEAEEATAWATRAAAWAAEEAEAAYQKFADKLIELLEQAI